MMNTNPQTRISYQEAKAMDRGLGNVLRVLAAVGATRERKPVQWVDLKPTAAGVELAGADGSTGMIPQPINPIPARALLALLGIAYPQGASDGAEVAALRVELAKAQQEVTLAHQTITARGIQVDGFRQGLKDMDTRLQAALADANTARADLARAVIIGQGGAADHAKRADAAEREAAGLRAEVASLERTVSKLRGNVTTSNGDTVAAETMTARPTAPGSILDALRQRGDVEVSADGSAVRFLGKQGTGVADALKAAGYTWDGKAYKATGEKVWRRAA